jgi:hypothetical protein
LDSDYKNTFDFKSPTGNLVIGGVGTAYPIDGDVNCLQSPPMLGNIKLNLPGGEDEGRTTPLQKVKLKNPTSVWTNMQNQKRTVEESGE